jgi:ADP-ribose pyrophosphatase YjhB (NUDIX family)
MKKHSCGAILYTIKNNQIFIILGKEYTDWFPFKGICEQGETFEEAAVREINEETCGIINIPIAKIQLNCHFSTQRKQYHIGLVYVDNFFLRDFYNLKKNPKCEKKFLEKTQIKLFALNTLSNFKFHYVTYIPIRFYWMQLNKAAYYLRIVQDYPIILLLKSRMCSKINTILDSINVNHHYENDFDTKLMLINYHLKHTLKVV